MRMKTDIGKHAQKPEYRQALQELIKYELQALVERLSQTGEEAVILTASLQHGTTTQLASPKAEGFLLKQKKLGSEFLNYFNEDGGNSSGDEVCTYDDDAEIGPSASLLPKSGSSFSSTHENIHANTENFQGNRSRERTLSRRLSLSREGKTGSDVYEVSQTSDLSASERNDSASSVSSFVEAREQESSINNLECKICNRSFRSFKILNSHIKRHMVKSYKCNVCGVIFSVKASYQRHMKTHHKVFECGFCEKSFPDQLSWKQHRERHFGTRNFSCNICGKAFYEKYSLKVHQTSHFISTQKTEKSVDSNAGFSCHICQKLSKTKVALKNHILTHSAKKHACEFCNKRFSLKYSYIRHRRIHTGEKPYKCGLCGKPFSDSSAWAKHVRTHSGIKPYSCNICPKSFYDKSGCKTHMKVHRNQVNQQIESKKCNFNLRSDKAMIDEYKDNLIQQNLKENKPGELQYEAGTKNVEVFPQLTGTLGESDKESDNSNLLDSGFGPDLLANEETAPKILENVNSGKMSTLLDSVELDEKFQEEFVERNMPAKNIESDSELISTTFPDETELLEETESENQTENIEKLSSFSHKTSPEVSVAVSAQLPVRVQRKSSKKLGSKRSAGKWIPESPSKCKKCHRVFKQESLLKQHLQFHCMMKLYKCRYCGKQLSTKHSLVRHERIHVGDRPYQCYICQKSFADNYGCIRHIKQHFNNESKNVTTFPFTKSSIQTRSEDVIKLSDSNDQDQDRVSSIHMKQFPSNISAFEQLTCQKQQKTMTKTDIKSTSLKIEPNKTDVDIFNENLPDSETKHQNGPVCKNDTPKSVYRCYNCSLLFPTQEDCIKHIQQNCNKNIQTEFVSVPHSGDPQALKKDNSQLKNIYQCSVCKMMFSEETACRLHQAQECGKQKPHADAQVSSLFQDTVEYSSQNKADFEPLPSLPFPDISPGQSLLDLSEDVMVLADDYPGSTLPDTHITLTSAAENQSTFMTFNQMPTLSSTYTNISTASQETSPQRTEINFTGLVPKPTTVSQGAYIVPSQGLSLLNTSKISSVFTSPTENSSKLIHEPMISSKVDKLPKSTKTESNVEERTCGICNKIFTNKHILKQHLLIHMERKFGCKYCLKKFHNKYGRDRHERIHTGEKPYSCPKCKKAFSDNSTYRKHTRICCSGK